MQSVGKQGWLGDMVEIIYRRGVSQRGSKVKIKAKPKMAKQTSTPSLRERLLELGVGQKGCPGLDRLVGPVNEGVDRQRLLRIGKKLTGLSREIIEYREDRW
jgi:hypothetical protein